MALVTVHSLLIVAAVIATIVAFWRPVPWQVPVLLLAIAMLVP